MVDLAKDALKIIDYGAARHSGDVDKVLSENFEACYNYEYVPPEIFQQIHVGPGTDMWGVGLIIFIMYVCVCVMLCSRAYLPDAASPAEYLSGGSTGNTLYLTL